MKAITLRQVAADTYRTAQADKEHGVFVPFRFMALCNGNAYDAMLLAQLVYWFGYSKSGKQRTDYMRDGELWVVKTYHEWKDELGFNSARTVEQCMKRLTDKGLVIKACHKSRIHDGKTVLHIRLDEEKVYRSTYHVDSGSTYHVDSGSTYHVEPSVETKVETNVDDKAPPSNDFTDLPLPDDDDPANQDLSRLHEAYRTKINSVVPYTLAVSFSDYVETHGIEAMLRAVEYCQKLGGKSKTAFLRIVEATAPITDKEMLGKALQMTYEKASGNDRTAYFARVLEGLREMKVMPEPKPAPRPRYIDAQAALADVELDYDD